MRAGVSLRASFLILTLICLVPAFAGQAQAQSTTSEPSRLDDPDKLSVSIHPVFAWLPSFSSSVTLPPLPDGGPAGGGETDSSISGALAFAGAVTVNKWLVEGEMSFVSAESTRSSPLLEVATDLSYGELFVGRYVGKGFYILGGVRQLSLEFNVNAASLPTFTRKPSLWDPLIGVEWRRALGRKVLVQLRADGGGFGVGSDVDLDFQAHLEWRFIKHVGVAVGYQALHTRTSGTIAQTIGNTTLNHPWEYNQTFQGPILGVGIHF